MLTFRNYITEQQLIETEIVLLESIEELRSLIKKNCSCSINDFAKKLKCWALANIVHSHMLDDGGKLMKKIINNPVESAKVLTVRYIQNGSS